MHKLFQKTERQQRVYPCRIHISSQTGRQYLLGFIEKEQEFRFFRLDTIHKVKVATMECSHDDIMEQLKEFSRNLWGVSVKKQEKPDHLEMSIHAETSEPFILQRLIREKRNGTVTVLDDHTYLYQTDTYDAMEMLPLIRTFIGRIVRLECSNTRMMERYCQDLDAIAALYGGE